MPYITNEARRDLLTRAMKPSTAGEFNFLISTIANDYLARYGKSYAVINELIGMLECTKLELYRRIAAPYEDEKKLANGDVFTI